MLKIIKSPYSQILFVFMIMILNGIIYFFNRQEKIIFGIGIFISFSIAIFLFKKEKKVDSLKEIAFLFFLFVVIPKVLIDFLPIQGNLDVINIRNLVLSELGGLKDGFIDDGTDVYWLNDCSNIRAFGIRNDFGDLTWKQNLIFDKAPICNNCYYYHIIFKNNNNFPLKNINAKLIVLDPDFRYESDNGLVIEEMVGFFGKSGLYVNIPYLDKKEEKRLIIFTHGDYNLYFECVPRKNYDCIQYGFDTRIIKKGGLFEEMSVWAFTDEDGYPIIIRPHELQGADNYKFNHKSNKFERIEGQIDYYGKKC